MFDYRRTHDCGTLTAKDIGSTVTLSGWVNRRRDHGGLVFIDLRDRFGLTQLVFDPKQQPEEHALAEKLRSEWVVSVVGEVIPRAEGMTNPKLRTGEIEILVRQAQILSKAETPPFSICDEFIEVNEELRLKYRYLDMRRGDVANRLEVRHRAMMSCRRYMDQEGFLEVQTPVLCKSTPEGARDYLVPSRVYPGKFYALPQSPQMFKQLLMIGGMDRYFQICPCFRDEDLRANRQPEFTQIDIEMSFATPEDLFPLAEALVKNIFKDAIGVDLPLPCPRLTYQECMERYGTDKPDRRFGMELKRLDDLAERSSFSVFHDQLKAGGTVRGLCVKGGSDLSRRMIDDYTSFVGKLGIRGLAWMKCQEGKLASNIVKFFPENVQADLMERLGVEEGDLIFMVADQPSATNQALDHLRRKLAQDRNLIKPDAYELLWVTDFPLFAWNAEDQRLDSEHHPFTGPHPDDLDLIKTDPLNVRSSSYDLVLNGHELASGSQRIHDSELQKVIFQALNLSEQEVQTKFGFFVEALRYGTPPHLGCALGLDRLIMIMTQTENIRDVIAFPKTQRASDLMMEAPSAIQREQLDELGLKLQDPEFSWL